MQTDQANRYALVVEDHPLVAESLAACINVCDKSLEVRFAESLAAALCVIASRSAPLPVVTDLTLTDSNGTETIRRLRAAAPHSPLLVFTAIDEARIRGEAEALGATCYLIKSASIQSLRDQIHAIVGARLDRGATATPGHAAGLSTTIRLDTPSSLVTPKQREVLEEMAAGRSNKEIAVELGISAQTVASHAKEIFIRLGVKNRTEAVVRYLQVIGLDNARGEG